LRKRFLVHTPSIVVLSPVYFDQYRENPELFLAWTAAHCQSAMDNSRYGVVVKVYRLSTRVVVQVRDRARLPWSCRAASTHCSVRPLPYLIGQACRSTRERARTTSLCFHSVSAAFRHSLLFWEFRSSSKIKQHKHKQSRSTYVQLHTEHSHNNAGLDGIHDASRRRRGPHPRRSAARSPPQHCRCLPLRALLSYLPEALPVSEPTSLDRDNETDTLHPHH